MRDLNILDTVEYTNASISPATVYTPPIIAQISIRKLAKLFYSFEYFTVTGDSSYSN